MEIKSLTIYCASSNNLDKKYYDLSIQIGEFLGKKNIKIIYGGGSIGMMGHISRSSMKVGGKLLELYLNFWIKKRLLIMILLKLLLSKICQKERKNYFN